MGFKLFGQFFPFPFFCTCRFLTGKFSNLYFVLFILDRCPANLKYIRRVSSHSWRTRPKRRFRSKLVQLSRGDCDVYIVRDGAQRNQPISLKAKPSPFPFFFTIGRAWAQKGKRKKTVATIIRSKRGLSSSVMEREEIFACSRSGDPNKPNQLGIAMPNKYSSLLFV